MIPWTRLEYSTSPYSLHQYSQFIMIIIMIIIMIVIIIMIMIMIIIIIITLECCAGEKCTCLYSDSRVAFYGKRTRIFFHESYMTRFIYLLEIHVTF